MSQGKETSLELQNLIVKLKDEKKSYSEIAKIVKKPRSTVQTICRNYVMRGNVLNKSRCGRPHKLSDRDARAIVRKVKKNPKISAPKLADQIATASGKKVHPETVRRILRSGGYNGRVSSKKPFISSVNQQKRLDFASPHGIRSWCRRKQPVRYWLEKEGESEKVFFSFSTNREEKIIRRQTLAMILGWLFLSFRLAER
ncbi:transposable element Tc1 transposase [Trichonephila inaurata madagascariensis]|uniref:Transposable element Tc1 transposase n=1 Tax=Trichonephila inaurata madagascariensis TaxID=2747483 RepID=A0A8X7C2P7_9ARAC|nr:transposable element Tc1 transposase [Trichonephila inaurata madagascariensis]